MKMVKILWALGCASVLGCAAKAGPPAGGGEDGHVRLPGDIDDLPADEGGKEDAWNSANDPARLATSFNYRIDELPRSGATEHEVWAASYWPTYQGSTNHRWLGPTVLSPVEKYDAAFNGWAPSADYADLSDLRDCGDDASERYTAYRAALGSAARWQAGAQSRTQMFDGVDSDDDGQVDECGWEDYDGIETWWGLCHAWVPASILEPEPMHAVEYNGQRFEVSDIKALLLTAYDDTRSYFLGGRCNAREIEHDDQGRVTSDECRDTNAGAWHVVVTNFLGVHGRPFVEDRTGGYQVWNQPVVGYEITHQEDVTLDRALDLLGVEGDAYPFNPQAARFVEVRMTTTWVTEGHPSTRPLGRAGYERADRYHYLLEIDDRGKVIGGEWLGASRDAHPDFLWVPIAADTSAWRTSNPNVQLENVRRLLELSREPEGGDDPVEEERRYENRSPVAIPDADRNGARSVIAVPDAFAADRVSVSVEIGHTWRGDLRVELVHGSQTVVLHDRAGGSADDLRQTFTLDDFVGAEAAGEWTLRVSDHVRADTGTIERWSLAFLTTEDGGDADGGTVEASSADVPVPIPDNDATGATATLDIPDDVTIETLSVAVDIQHPYRGDLQVELLHDARSVLLWDRAGGSADDLIQSFTPADFAGESARGTWTLRVRDRAARDTGTIRGFELRIN